MEAELLAIAIDLARRAGDLVAAGRERAGTDCDTLDVAAKTTPTDVVTAVDTAAERFLTEQLGRLRPEDAILGEEGARATGSSGVRWLVDPIDGTVNFLYGLPQYAVSVAAERDGTVLAGAVHSPASGETFWASRGGGAWLSVAGAPEARLRASDRAELALTLVATGFSYSAEARARQAAVLAGLLPRVRDIRRLGSAALDLCYCAAGRLDAYYEADLKPWDFAAGALIAEEAGAVLSGLRGRAAGTDLVAAAAPGVAEPFFRLLEELGVQ
jgi:myo-inositol-1(or 4)-monophosphatase